MAIRTQIPDPSRPSKNLSKKERKIVEAARDDKNIICTFDDAVVLGASDKAAAAALLPAEAAAGQELSFQVGRDTFEMHHAVVETTGTALYSLPTVSADGLEVVLDADVTDGITAYELSNGILSTDRAAFTVGGEESIFFEAQVKIDDVTDLDQIFCGFRKAEAYQAEPDNYDELVAWHIGETGATVADGQINIASILNGGATSYTDTTNTDWADGEEKILKVILRSNGSCEFYIDGSLPTVTKGFSFDDGEVVVPFFFAENTSGSTTGDPGVSIGYWKVGRTGR